MPTQQKILILGVGGFIGTALLAGILKNTPHHVYGMDLSDDQIQEYLGHERFTFHKGDITVDHAFVTTHIQNSDCVFPLVAIANPALYVTDPLRVFDLDFEANLAIIKQCAAFKKRVIFPSTSEVYGMCPDAAFDEETSPLVMGPIHKQRWIYGASKQLLDRVIYAYGVQHNLDYTIFRPFNWIGPKIDAAYVADRKPSRVITQFITDVIHHQKITLVDGGNQRRSFTDIEDGITALLMIIDNPQSTQHIFNIGNPHNDISMKELASLMITLMKGYPVFKEFARKTVLTVQPAADHYGTGYQDILHRVPSIAHIGQILGWQPTHSLTHSLTQILDHYARIIAA